MTLSISLSVEKKQASRSRLPAGPRCDNRRDHSMTPNASAPAAASTPVTGETSRWRSIRLSRSTSLEQARAARCASRGTDQLAGHSP